MAHFAAIMVVHSMKTPSPTTLTAWNAFFPPAKMCQKPTHIFGFTTLTCIKMRRRSLHFSAATHGVPIIKGTDAYLSYPKRSAQAKGSHAFLGNGDSVIF